MSFEKDTPIFVAGHRGMVGVAVVRSLEKAGYTQLLKRSHQELDLTEQAAVRRFFAEQRPRGSAAFSPIIPGPRCSFATIC